MSAIRRMMMAAKKSILPSGYTRLEYITNPSTAYIDAGVALADTYTIHVVFQATNSEFFVTGVNGKSGNPIAYIFHSVQQWRTRPSKSFSLADGNKHDIYLSNGVVTCDGVTKTFDGGTVLPAKNIIICAAYANGNLNTIDARRMVGKLFTAQITDNNGNYLFNGIPVKNSSNAVGLYDIVSQSFFTSASDVEFTEN